MSESLLRNFTHITIPAEIWLRRDISIQGKALWAELRSLHSKEKGGCYASDEYLCEFMGLKRSRLHELYKELKDSSLMEVVSFNGRLTVRRAVVPPVEYQEQTGQQVSGKPDTSYPENRTATIRDPGLPLYIENKEDNKEEREGVNTPKPPARADLSSIKKERAPFVLLSDIDHQKLIDKLGPEVTASCYQILSEWKEDSPKSKWKRCDYRSILRWVIDRYKENKAKAAKAQAEIDTPEENKAHAAHVAENFNPVRCPDRGYRIDVLSKHVEIVPIRSPNARSLCINYTEKGFKEQLESGMRKCGLY